MSELMGLLLTFAPLFLLMYLANAAEARREVEEPYSTLAWLAYLGTAALYFGGLLVGVGFQAMFSLSQQQPELMEDLLLATGGTDPLGAFESPMLIGAGLWISSLVGLILLLKPVRRMAARILPMDPESPVHAVALSWTMLIVINLVVTLGIGLGTLTDVLEAAGEAGSGMTMLVLWVQQILTALLALVGVGWLTRLAWGKSLDRAGIVWPTGQQIGIGIGYGVAMVPIVMVIGAIATQFNLGVDPNADALTEELLGPLFGSWLGIITLGLAAALGEETLFRGAVQPRFGIIVTALLFALVHSNYGITISTLIVFVLGLLLGHLRNRHNTTTAMVMHAVYNMTLGLLALLGMSWLDV